MDDYLEKAFDESIKDTLHDLELFRIKKVNLGPFTFVMGVSRKGVSLLEVLLR